MVLAHEYLLFRVALAAAFEQQGGIQVVGDAGDGRTAAALATELRPSVALIDVALPGRDGIGVCADIKAAVDRTRVILLSDRPTTLRSSGVSRRGPTASSPETSPSPK